MKHEKGLSIILLYLINLTFFAGDNAPENTDRGLYCLESPEPITDDILLRAYKAANEALNDKTVETDLSYENGCNIDTLNTCAEKYLNATISEIRPCSGEMHIQNYYEIEIWQ